jgi:hypothetical protein
MARVATPISDVYASAGWQTQSGGSASLYSVLGGETPDDSSYIASPESPSEAVYVCDLSSLSDPGVKSGHYLVIRVTTDRAEGQTFRLIQELREGYVSEAQLGRLISKQEVLVSGTSWITYEAGLRRADVDAIGDYTNLQCRVVVSLV